jgi:hypothetical protein
LNAIRIYYFKGPSTSANRVACFKALSLSLFQKAASPPEKLDWIQWLSGGQLGQHRSHPALTLSSAKDQTNLEQAERDKMSHEMHPCVGCVADIYTYLLHRKSKSHFLSPPLNASLVGG